MAGKGGGAWKVAYADFVTAMMAFFLVMWLCAQDQKVKRAVSDYFSDPLGAVGVEGSKKPNRSGSIAEFLNSGGLPMSEAVAMGKGRQAYTQQNKEGYATKLVSDHIYRNKDIDNYWREQAKLHKTGAGKTRDIKDMKGREDKVAVWLLAKQMREELSRDVPPEAKGIYRELILEIIAEVNWTELAEDMLAR